MLRIDLQRTVQRQLRRVGLEGSIGLQLAVWLLLVAFIIQLRLPVPDAAELPYYMLLLVAAGLAAALLMQLTAREGARPVVPRARSIPMPRWTLVGAAAGIACAAIGARLAGPDQWNAQWWWLAGMTVPLVTLIIARPVRSPSQIRTALPWLAIGEAVALFAMAMIVRSIDITSSPPFLLGDEASCGLYGRIFNAGQTPLLSISWSDLPMLTYAITGVGLHVFSDDWAGMRMISAVVGSLGVVLVYLLGKEWFSRRAGLVAAVLLGFGLLHVELSRDALQSIQGPTAISLTLYLCTLWIKRGGLVLALLAGISLSVDLQVYWSARIVFVLVPVMMVLIFLQDRALLLSRQWEMAWMAIGGVVSILPLAGLFYANPGTFGARQGDVNIFGSSTDLKNHLISQYGHAGMASVLVQQTWKVLTAFNARGDASVIWGPWGKPMLDPISAALLPAGMALALVRLRRWPYALCLLWILAVLGASAITIDPPLWPRLLSLSPAVALLIGVLLAELWSRFSVDTFRTALATATVALLLGVIAVKNVQEAFVDYPGVSRQSSMEATDVGLFLAHAPGAARTVLLSDGSIAVDYEPIRFLAPRASGCTLLQGQALSQCPLARDSKLFVLLPGRVSDLAWLERQRPGGRVVTVGVYGYGAYRILAYELS